MVFHTYEWKKEYKPSSLMKGLELLKEKFEHYQVRENMIQKFHYYTENIDGYWVSFPIIVEKERAYFCPVLIEPFNNDLYQNLEDGVPSGKRGITTLRIFLTIYDPFIFNA